MGGRVRGTSKYEPELSFIDAEQASGEVLERYFAMFRAAEASETH